VILVVAPSGGLRVEQEDLEGLLDVASRGLEARALLVRLGHDHVDPQLPEDPGQRLRAEVGAERGHEQTVGQAREVAAGPVEAVPGEDRHPRSFRLRR